MLSRRDLVGKMAASAAVLCAAGAASASVAPRTAARGASAIGASPESTSPEASAQQPAAPTWQADVPPDTATAPPPWELLRPLAVGSALASGWRVAGLTGAVDGTCVLTLENERGRSQRVHFCRNDGRPQGLVYTDHVDLVVMNGGSGDLPTDEGFAQSVARVAHVLSVNEAHHRETVVASLLPHEERLRRFAGPYGQLR